MKVSTTDTEPSLLCNIGGSISYKYASIHGNDYESRAGISIEPQN